jgi:hypothetical protein
MGLVCDPRGLPGVTTAKPTVPRVLQKVLPLILESCRGMIECKRKQEHQNQQGNDSRPYIESSSAWPILRHVW